MPTPHNALGWKITIALVGVLATFAVFLQRLIVDDIRRLEDRVQTSTATHNSHYLYMVRQIERIKAELGVSVDWGGEPTAEELAAIRERMEERRNGAGG